MSETNTIPNRPSTAGATAPAAAACCAPTGCSPAEAGTANRDPSVELSNLDDAQLKEAIRRRYASAARAAAGGDVAGCGCGCSAEAEALIGAGLYGEDDAAVSPRAAQASLGCANPVLLADLHPGETVLDLGSGGGLDVLLSARRVAPGGRAIGVDMTDDMLELARRNQREAGIDNAEFLKGEIEELPLPPASVDVVLSNCVVNLSPDKGKVLREAYRVLRPGGRLAIADLVRTRDLPAGVAGRLDAWSACLAGALDVARYQELLAEAGFAEARVEILHHYDPGALGEAVVPVLAEVGCTLDDVKDLFASVSVKARRPVATAAG